MNMYLQFDIDCLMREQQTQLPQWASAERLEYVDSFMEWWFRRK